MVRMVDARMGNGGRESNMGGRGTLTEAPVELAMTAAAPRPSAAAADMSCICRRWESRPVGAAAVAAVKRKSAHGREENFECCQGRKGGTS